MIGCGTAPVCISDQTPKKQANADVLIAIDYRITATLTLLVDTPPDMYASSACATRHKLELIDAALSIRMRMPITCMGIDDTRAFNHA